MTQEQSAEIERLRAERDELQVRIDWALSVLSDTYWRGGHATKEAIQILRGTNLTNNQ